MSDSQSVNLFDIIAYVESTNNPLAIRFEPIVYSHIMASQTAPQKLILQNIARIHNCSFGTAEMIYSTSWGPTQIMGFNLYGQLGYTKTVHEFQDDQIAQLDMFIKFCEQQGIEYQVSELASDPIKKQTFAKKYNGDIVAYSKALDMSLHHYGVI